jgi:hypothetical protein
MLILVILVGDCFRFPTRIGGFFIFRWGWWRWGGLGWGFVRFGIGIMG